MIAPKLLRLLLVVLAFGWSGHGAAAMSPKEVQVIARMLAFMVNPPTGRTILGVVYAPGIPESQSEATALAEQLSQGLVIGQMTLYARLLPLNQLGQEADVAAIFIPASLGRQAELPANLARQLHVPSISNSLTCALDGQCAIGFVTSPTVQIIINRSVCESAAVKFLPAFRILVKEI